MLEPSLGSRRLARLDDERLAARVRTGDEAAFEALYDRHHASLLAFCRHMVGNREDGEDALQQTFLRAHRALREGRPPDSVRPWLFAIARNRCRTLLAARRDAAVPSDELEPSYDGLAEDVGRRADLRELVADLAGLPEDQRGALVLAELGDLSHPEIAGVIGCPPEKVKALVFQARTALIAERDARAMPCEDIRMQLEAARGGALRRGPLRRHLRQCEPCDTYRLAVARQRAGLAAILPVAPTVGLKAAVLGGAGRRWHRSGRGGRRRRRGRGHRRAGRQGGGREGRRHGRGGGRRRVGRGRRRRRRAGPRARAPGAGGHRARRDHGRAHPHFTAPGAAATRGGRSAVGSAQVVSNRQRSRARRRAVRRHRALRTRPAASRRPAARAPRRVAAAEARSAAADCRRA